MLLQRGTKLVSGIYRDGHVEVRNHGMGIAYCLGLRKLELMKLRAQIMFDVLEGCEALSLALMVFKAIIPGKVAAIALDGVVCCWMFQAVL